MRLYSGTSEQFVMDTVRNQIAEKLRISFYNYYGYNPSDGEVHSWQNSLRALQQVISYTGLDDHGIILEYQLPLTSRRLDCLITGKDAFNKDNAVIVELKQWDKCEESIGDKTLRDILHPSVQVGLYRMYLEDTHTAFYEEPDPIKLNSCAYLHNYHPYPGDVIFSDKFTRMLETDPVFTAEDVDKLSGFLVSKLEKGKGACILEKLKRVAIDPAKSL